MFPKRKIFCAVGQRRYIRLDKMPDLVRLDHTDFVDNLPDIK